MVSLKDPPKLGPFSKVTPSNAAGESNSDSAPQITAPTLARATTDGVRSDIATQTYIAIRVLCRLMLEANAINGGGSAGTDDLDALMADEGINLGTDDKG